MYISVLQSLVISAAMLVPALSFADPLGDCRELAAQMQSNSANDGIASYAITLGYKTQIADLQKQLAAITKERDELKAKQSGG